MHWDEAVLSAVMRSSLCAVRSPPEGGICWFSLSLRGHVLSFVLVNTRVSNSYQFSEGRIFPCSSGVGFYPFSVQVNSCNLISQMSVTLT